MICTADMIECKGDICPYGSQYKCIPINGIKYCSKYSEACKSFADPRFAPESSDVPEEGTFDKKNDGEIDENGNCKGTIYIFNGEDKRCRPAGISTYGTNCCKKSDIELLNLVSLGKCKESELYLSKLRSWGKLDGRCHYIGSYCDKKILDVCVQKKKTFCCFSSGLARIIQEQGREQLGIDWGTPTEPNCRGFTPEEFQKIDWNKIDFSEWIEDEVKPNIENNLQNNLQKTIDNIQQSIQAKYN